MDVQPKEFKDITIYTPGNVVLANICRIEAKWARIWVAPFAQYNRAVHVEFIRKRRRKAEAFVSSDRPYVVVVPTAHAIQPDAPYLPAVDGTSSGRYYAADPRWRMDFDEQIHSANVPIWPTTEIFLLMLKQRPPPPRGQGLRLINCWSRQRNQGRSAAGKIQT